MVFGLLVRQLPRVQASHPEAYHAPGARDRVLRGGSFLNPAQYARSAFRYGYHPSFRIVDLGFRPARVITG